ncbi:hypothetical protein [Alteribacillus sp. YIM 98480]|uniref:hypothetical protein n=1 Tax=Alteribacillus sp. YIM 98480 TaxID=2606599 RepID=UPI00131D7B32|nr:hypothetical protein [Alteribacillus sp. YIM 98480]
MGREKRRSGKKNNLSSQVHVFSLTTDAFLFEDEQAISDRLKNNRIKSKELKKLRKLNNKNKFQDKINKLINEKQEEVQYSSDSYYQVNKDLLEIYILLQQTKTFKNTKKELRDFIKLTKKKIEDDEILLKQRIKENIDKEVPRELNPDALYFNDKEGKQRYNGESIISLFDSTLTRTIGAEVNKISTDIIVVKTYHFEILENMINNGFTYQGEFYIFLTASAGQMRQRKSMWIKEVAWEKHKNQLTCGLSAYDINDKDGVNINKYLAYLALSATASKKWTNFSIDRAIVVNDLETDVYAEVDYINRDTYKINRKKMDIPIEHTDGAGMILPRNSKKSKKSFMFRMPFFKGLLIPIDFKAWINEHEGASMKVKDIYNKTWDIEKNGIEIIFTKSQFKMWKYYKNWQEYKDNFKKYNCEAAKLNEETKPEEEIKLSYQYLQTLTDVSDEELKALAQPTIDEISNIAKDKDNMMKALGVDMKETEKEKIEKRTYYQQALTIYPELIDDPYSKQMIKDKKEAMINGAKAGKLNIKGNHVYICPDMYAFCERLFLHKEKPEGLLKNGEVFCKLYENGTVDMLRSPHLYREHGTRQNVIDEEKKKWFITNGIYTSIYDPISKLLQFDCDGDSSPVIQDKLFTDIAERNIRIGEKDEIVPLYYKMEKADAQIIDKDNIIKSIELAYQGNIGEISNNISKIWNDEELNISAVKWLTAYNNYMIDFAKTNFLPEPKGEKEEIIDEYKSKKLPYFFKFAKNKKRVQPKNKSVVNRLEDIIDNSEAKKQIQFKKHAGGWFDYKLLMSNQQYKFQEEDYKIIDKYKELSRQKKKMMYDEDGEKRNLSWIHQEMKKQLLNKAEELKMGEDEEKRKKRVVNVLVKYAYTEEAKYKSILWDCFGNIILGNLNNNVENTKQCKDCLERIEKKNNRQKYCDECAKMREKRRLERKNRKKKK